MPDTELTGRILFYDRFKRIGFIAPNDKTADVFFRGSSLLVDTPNPHIARGHRCRYQLTPSPSRPGENIACNITLLDGGGVE